MKTLKFMKTMVWGNYYQHAETSKSRIIIIIVVIFDPSVGNYGTGERGKILKSHDGGS